MVQGAADLAFVVRRRRGKRSSAVLERDDRSMAGNREMPGMMMPAEQDRLKQDGEDREQDPADRHVDDGERHSNDAAGEDAIKSLSIAIARWVLPTPPQVNSR